MHKLLVQHFAKRMELETAGEDEFFSALHLLVNLGGDEIWLINGPFRGYSTHSQAQVATDATRRAMDAGRLDTLVSVLQRRQD